MKRCVIFAHFDRKNQIAQHVLFYLRELKANCQHLVFVSTSSLEIAELNKLDGITDKNIVRENVGYDFMSWKLGLSTVKNLADYDEVVICNDSVYGPFKPLKGVFEKMSGDKFDFWGITNNLDMGEHIQSYFVTFSQQVVQSQAFIEFWSSVKPASTKHDVVKKFEVQLTQKLANHGFNFGVLTPYKRKWALKHLPNIIFRKVGEQIFSSKNPAQIPSQKTNSYLRISKLKQIGKLIYKTLNLSINPTQYTWKEVIDNGSPFLKIELFKENPAKVSLNGWESVVNSTNYFPTNNIKNHMTNEIQHSCGDAFIGKPH